MFWILVFSLCFILFLSAPLQNLKFVIDSVQASCIAHIPEHQFREVSLALICGKSIQSAPLWNWFLTLGIAHAVVTSAAQLHLLSSWFRRYPWIEFLVLVVFLGCSGAQAPVVRAFFAWVLHAGNERFLWNRKSFEIFLASLGLSLAVQPRWSIGLSWHLTVCASAALIATQLFRANFRISRKQVNRLETEHSLSSRFGELLLEQFFICLFLLPFSVQWNQLNGTSILANLTLGVLMGLVLFPFGILGMMVPPFMLVFDAFFHLMQILASEFFSVSANAEALSRANTPQGFGFPGNALFFWTACVVLSVHWLFVLHWRLHLKSWNRE